METTETLASPIILFKTEVLTGLKSTPKFLHSKYFYDTIGSELFDDICELEEYYPTRTDQWILSHFVDEMKAEIGEDAFLVEYGSGSSLKTTTLLDALDLAGYVPIDIAGEHLLNSAGRLEKLYPDLNIIPVEADYTTEFSLPEIVNESKKVVFFPGSTIGNFCPGDAKGFLIHIAEVVGKGGGLLIGVDLKKDPNVLHAAYNDSKGVTAAFNKNVLVRVNDELGANFDLNAFEHYAFYNPSAGRIEMHLVSLKNQAVTIDNEEIYFSAGESIHTENSYKYTVEQFKLLVESAGFTVKKVWTDPLQKFSVQYLSVNAETQDGH